MDTPYVFVAFFSKVCVMNVLRRRNSSVLLPYGEDIALEICKEVVSLLSACRHAIRCLQAWFGNLSSSCCLTLAYGIIFVKCIVRCVFGPESSKTPMEKSFNFLSIITRVVVPAYSHTISYVLKSTRRKLIL